MNDTDLQTISTRDKFAIATILHKSLFLTIDKTVNISQAIDSAGLPLSPRAEKYLRDLNGAAIVQIRALGTVILRQLAEAFLEAE